MQKRELVIPVHEWMMSEYKLSGNELLVYALIFKVTEDGESEYAKGLSYISEKLNISINSACSVLSRLLEKGLVEKKEVILKMGKMCNYKAVVTMEEIKRVQKDIVKKEVKAVQSKLDKLAKENSRILDKALSEFDCFDNNLLELIWDWKTSVDDYNYSEYATKKIIFTKNAMIANLKQLVGKNKQSVILTIKNGIAKPDWGKFYFVKDNRTNKAQEPSSGRTKEQQSEIEQNNYIKTQVETRKITPEQALQEYKERLEHKAKMRGNK